MTVQNVFTCPTVRSLQCSWEGASEDILEHFIMEHEDLLLHSSEVDIDLTITSENRLLFLDGEIYLIQLIIDGNSLNIGLRYLGPKRLANNISYDIILRVEEQLYFHNYFENNSSLFKILNGFWTVDLNMLKLIHDNLNIIQCNFSISKNFTETDVDDNEYASPATSDNNQGDNNQIPYDNNNDDSSDSGTVIDDGEIDDILNEDVQLRQEQSDALDNMSVLNFSLLENSRYSRRYSSFVGIPQGLFDEKETANLTCSNCYKDMLPPIYICVNNHNICADHKDESCKICNGDITENRNKDLEDYSRKCLHLCQYHIEGCLESFMYNEIRNHEMKCMYCIYKCINNCVFKGKFSEFHSHFRVNHPSYKIVYSTPVNFPRNSEFVVFNNKLGIFHCSSSINKNSVTWIVISLGPSDRNFLCEITFKETKARNISILRKQKEQYSVAHTKEDLKKMRVKDKNAVLTISSYFQ
ncbi:hypothetical protein WA026_010201 [Henosepilachna vigintioctopunctata]|uniref:SIAH-type domain-containing protein n=1 Tax=Henosepilachna vigintioctopunctata TaxID=420089 RepID=A0AAW1UKP7_9CUCU